MQNKKKQAKPPLKLKGAHFEKGTLVEFRTLSNKFFGIWVYRATTEDEWPEKVLEGMQKRILENEDLDFFYKNRKGIGLIVSDPNFKRNPYNVEGSYVTFYKVLINEKLFWIDSRHLFKVKH